MPTTGVQFEQEQLKELRELAEQDKRSLGFLIREAIDDYLAKRRRIAEEKRLAEERSRRTNEETLALIESWMSRLTPENRAEVMKKLREADPEVLKKINEVGEKELSK